MIFWSESRVSSQHKLQLSWQESKEFLSISDHLSDSKPHPTTHTHTHFSPSYYPEDYYKKSGLTLGSLSNQFSCPLGCSVTRRCCPLQAAFPEFSTESGFSQGAATGREIGKPEKRKSLGISTSGYISCTVSWQEMPATVQNSTTWPQPLGPYRNHIAICKCSKSTCRTP